MRTRRLGFFLTIFVAFAVAASAMAGGKKAKAPKPPVAAEKLATENHCGEWWLSQFAVADPKLRDWLVLPKENALDVHGGMRITVLSLPPISPCEMFAPTAQFPSLQGRHNSVLIQRVEGNEVIQPLKEWSGGVIERAGWTQDGKVAVVERNYDGKRIFHIVFPYEEVHP